MASAEEMERMDTLRSEQVSAVSANMAKLRDENDLTDVTLVCQGGTICAHQFVLSAASSYFYKLFKSGMLESNTNEIHFKETSVRTVEIVVKFLYTGQMPPKLKADEELLEEILKTAHLMQIEPLFNYCWSEIFSNLKSSNFVHIWSLADLYDQRDSQTRIMAFILKNIVIMEEEDHYLEMSSDQMQSFVDFASEHCSSDNLIDFILKWGNSNMAERQTHMLTLIKQIDMFKLSTNCLQKINLTKGSNMHESLILTEYLLTHTIERLQFTQKYLQLHFWSSLNEETGQMFSQIYCFKENNWYVEKETGLPINVFKSWHPIINGNGKQFYLARNKDEQIVIRNGKTLHCYTGPKVQKLITWTFCGNDLYIYGADKFIQFNCESYAWNILSNIRLLGKANKLVACQNKLFFVNASEDQRFIKEYDKVNHSWKSTESLNCDGYGIECKCLQDNCNVRLMYFVRSESQLMSFDPVSNYVYVEREVPGFKGKRPLIFNCDNHFILLNEIADHKKLWIYYPVSDAWVKLPDGLSDKIDENMICSMCLK